MKVLFIRYNVGSGEAKLASALQSQGVETHLLYSQYPEEWKLNSFNSLTFMDSGRTPVQSYWDTGTIKKLINKIKPDVIQTSAETDNIVLELKRLTKIPVVHLINDIFSEGFEGFVESNSEIERLAYTSADAVINRSAYAEELMLKKYPETIKKPKRILPCYMSKKFIPQRLPFKDSQYDKKTHIIYEGGYWNFGFRNYEEYFEALSLDNDLVIDVYPVGSNIPLQTPKGVMYHTPRPFPSLLREISRYNIGYVGGSGNSNLMNTALPNKMFDYHFAGLPIAVQNFKEMANLVKQNPDIGFVWNNIQEFLDKYKEWKDVIVEPQMKFTMEENIKPILQLYEEVQA